LADEENENIPNVQTYHAPPEMADSITLLDGYTGRVFKHQYTPYTYPVLTDEESLRKKGGSQHRNSLTAPHRKQLGI